MVLVIGLPGAQRLGFEAHVEFDQESDAKYERYGIILTGLCDEARKALELLEGLK